MVISIIQTIYYLDKQKIMMKALLPIFLITLKISYVFAQFPFEKGQIQFKDGSVLTCQIQLALGYDSLVIYKLVNSSEVIKAKVNKIRSLSTPYNNFDNINIDGSEFLLRRLVIGKANLYSHSIEIRPEQVVHESKEKEKAESKKNKDKKNKHIELKGSSWRGVQIIYVIIVNESLYAITEENFMDLSKILNDHETIAKDINEGAYSFKDMIQIIETYNK